MTNKDNKTIAGYQFGMEPKIKPLNVNGVIRFLTTKNYQNQITDLNIHKELFGKNDEFRRLKEQLPSLAFGGWFKDGVRKQSEIVRMSGLLLADIDEKANDHLSHEQMLMMLEQLKKHPATFYADLSSSGKGIHCLFRIPIVEQHIKEYFRHAFRVIASDFREDWGVIIDSQVSGIQSVKFLGFGKDPYINEDAVEYNIPEYAPKQSKKSSADRNRNISSAHKFMNTLMDKGIYNEESDKVLYKDAPERHGWIVKAAVLLFKTFDLEKSDMEELLLPIAQHPASLEGRLVGNSEIKRIIDWGFEQDWDEEKEYIPEDNRDYDLPFDTNTYEL